MQRELFFRTEPGDSTFCWASFSFSNAFFHVRGRLCIPYLLFAPWTVKLHCIEPGLLIAVKGFKHKRLASTLRTAVVLILLKHGTFLAEGCLAFATLGGLVDHFKTNAAIEVAVFLLEFRIY